MAYTPRYRNTKSNLIRINGFGRIADLTRIGGSKSIMVRHAMEPKLMMASLQRAVLFP